MKNPKINSMRNEHKDLKFKKRNKKIFIMFVHFYVYKSHIQVDPLNPL